MPIDVERELQHIRATVADGDRRQVAFAALAKRLRAQVQKERNVPTLSTLMAEHMKNGMTAGDAWSRACQQSPDAAERHRQGFIDPPVQKPVDAAPVCLVVTDPPGTVRKSDGTIELVNYDRYRAHFMRQR